MSEIYFVFKNGAIYTDVPACEITLQDDGVYFSDACEYETHVNYEEIYAIGIITEDGCDVLWKEGG